ncbi:helix-turn-helix domain-containing protein [Acidobacteriota bacterium]
MEKFLKPKEICEWIGIEMTTLYSWTSNDLIPHYKIGKNLRFNVSKVERWLKSKERGISISNRLEGICKDIQEAK